MSDLRHMRVAIIAVDGFEESELLEPKKALENAGAQADVVSEKKGEIQGFKHFDKAGKVRVDRILDEMHVDEYDAIMLPGGALNADYARALPRVRQIIAEMDRARKPIAAICHAPWELISAEVVTGRKLTSWPTIQDDIRNAGAQWVDEEFVVDQNLVTSRGPKDLPVFNREMIALFAKQPVPQPR
jgi:protease I